MAPAPILPRQGQPPPSLRDTLKHATAAAHRALEDNALMRAVSTAVPGRATYAAYLASHWRVHAGLEPRIAMQLPAAWTQGRLQKSCWLQADLHALGLPLPPAGAPAPHVTSRAHAVGALYVLEGATLGLAMVRRRLEAAHPAHPAHPAPAGAHRFMTAYGEHTGAYWAEFLRLLATVDPHDGPAVCAGALATFTSFQRVFEDAWCSADHHAAD